MMSLDSVLALYLLLWTASLGWSLRLLRLEVPTVVDVRDEAILVCKFDVEGDKFFSLKWYKEELEFFRYMPDYDPSIQTFQVEGINLVESESNASAITLRPLEYASSGVYRCEVSAEAPHFKVVYEHANMTVLGLPEDDPRIDGMQDTYNIGSYVTANCTSSPSHPPARMDWFINGAKAEHWYLDYYNSGGPTGEFRLETRTIGLKFQADDVRFRQRKDGTLSLVCSSTVADRTRSTEIRAYLTELTGEKFAQQFTNHCGKVAPTIYVIIAVVMLDGLQVPSAGQVFINRT